MKSLFAAERAVLILFEFTRDVLAVFRRCIVLALALAALQSNNIDGRFFLTSHTVSPELLPTLLNVTAI